jgi:ribosomal protein S18 acetylase RimI-like enzyme
LEVAVNNTAAQALYLALDFVACGIRRNYYEHGDGGRDATVMRRDL